MKKGWKTFWIVSAAIAGVGVILLILGIVMGAAFNQISWHSSDGVSVLFPFKKTRTVKSQEQKYEFDNVRFLNIDVGQLEVNVIEAEGSKIRVETVGIDERLKLAVYQDEDELEIETKQNNMRINDGGTVNIYIPAGMKFEEADISIGAGVLELESLRVNEADIECGAGSIVIDRIEGNDITVSCGLGTVDLTAAGRKGDYNYEIECGIGSVEVGDDSYAGIVSEKKIRNGRNKTMDIECGMGEIIVSFEQK